MGLLDGLAGRVVGGGGRRDQTEVLVRSVLDALTGGDRDQPGVEDLARRFDRGGAGDVIDSWVGTGGNRSIDPGRLSDLLRGSRVERASERAGLGGGAGAAILAQLLPVLVDKLTPRGGEVPSGAALRERRNTLLRDGDSPFARPGGPMMAAKSSGGGDEPRPDFSNVQSGASSTAQPPKEESKAERTYTVVAGDNLSKIAKRHYGNANEWRKIFEANRDQLTNPDMIHPGQVLRIPE